MQTIAMDGPKQIQVIIPPLSQPRQRNDGHTNLSFGQALQFTPLATSMLPAHDRIPVPQLCRPKESARLTSSDERKLVQQTLARLPVGKVKNRLNSLLKSESLAQIKFKQCPPKASSLQQATQSKKAEYSLSAAGRMVLDMVSIDYRHPPEPANATRSPSVARSIPPHESPVTTAVQLPLASTMNTSVKTATSVRTSDQDLTPHPVLINVPAPPPTFKREDYAEIPEAAKRRKLSHDDSQAPPISIHVRSQRDASDAALLNFQNSLMEIFEAQDQLDAGSTAGQDAGLFEVPEDGDDSEPTLSLKTLERLNISLKKLGVLKRLSDVSVEHLRRLQRLCEPPIDRAQTVGLKVPSEASAEDEQDWRDRMRLAEIGINSATVCLHTILGCPNEEVLLFSDARLWIPNVLINCFETCLIPVIEARVDAQGSEIFATAANNKESLRRLLENGRKLLDAVSTVCAEVKGMDSSVNSLEFLCAKLIFVQNAANDKSSCLGIQAYEKVRKTAMSCLARIYARYPSERSIILDEVLSSVDKLPSNSRSARQYRLGNGKSIQLITALFMQLVQATALEMPEHGTKSKRRSTNQTTNATNDLGPDEDEDEDSDTMQQEASLHESSYRDHDEGPLQRLRTKATKLFDSSAKSAHDIIMYLVPRASKTTKTGDSPYRNILDLFIEDLVAVLPEPEWPSSELMLRILTRKMISLARNDKAALVKNMALESLGTMGSAISAQKALIPSLYAALDREGQQQSNTAAHLCQMAKEQDAGTLRGEDMMGIDGPFAVVSKQLWSDATQNLRVRSACGYFLAHYAKLVSRIPNGDTIDETDIEAQPLRVANWLLDLIPHVGSGTVNIRNFDAVNSEEAELAYALCILNVGFCSFFGDIVNTLATSFSSDSPQVRSRSLKSVVSMLETDSSLLDHDPTISENVFRCASDESALVRDSALSLIARFIISRPALQQKGIKRLLECASDPKVGVQRRAMGHLRDVYVNDSREFLRSKIASTFLERTGDHEETVAELARKTLLDIWINVTLSKLSDPVESKRQIAVEALGMEIVRCITHKPVEMMPLLQRFFESALKSEPKGSGKIRGLCSKVVNELFDKTISGAEDQGPLHVLAAFATADSQLIQPDRLAKLQSYLGHIKNDNDLFMFRSVIGIYCSVLPDLSATHKPLLAEIQSVLMKAIPSLGRRAELDPLMSCLRTIDAVLKNTLKLVKFTASVFNGIRINQQAPQKLTRLLRMAGAIARYLDLEGYFKAFAQEVKEFRGSTIADYMATVFNTLAQPAQSFEIRLLALEALGSLCQAWPIQFNNSSTRKTLFRALEARTTSTDLIEAESQQLQLHVLRAFDELYAERAQAKAGTDGNDETTEKQELGKLGGDSKTRDGDSAIVIITREVVNHVLRIALSTQGENALLAARTLSSISHEGLVHPKQSTGAFVALGTNPDQRIAAIAHEAHKILHQTHESVCEREYMHSVQEAFDYQRNIIHDACGSLADGYRSKLAACFEIINSSNAKYVKKFLSGLVARVANDVAIQDNKDHGLDQVLYARFIMQNLAFFEYRKLDDLLHTILQIELAYSKSGGEVVQLLEHNFAQSGHPALLVPDPITSVLDDQNLALERRHEDNIQAIRKLAPVAATLTLLMETRSYLVRQYGIGRDVRAAISNNKQAKDSGKAPTKVYGITGERIWNKTNNVVDSLDDESSMIACCQNFIGLMSVDEDLELEPEGPLRDAEQNGILDPNDYGRGGTPGTRKRKGSASLGNTPVKKQRARQRKEAERLASNSPAADDDDDDDDYDG